MLIKAPSAKFMYRCGWLISHTIQMRFGFLKIKLVVVISDGGQSVKLPVQGKKSVLRKTICINALPIMLCPGTSRYGHARQLEVWGELFWTH